MSDKTRTRRGELESNQRQLPADRRARGASGKALNKARDDASRTPLGQPPKPVDVRSVYDTRPVNAFDFNIPATAATASTDSQASLFFQVPEGFICVLRNFDIWFEPTPIGLERSAFLWSLQLNGGDYPYNIGVPFGIAIDRETVFMIANEFNTVGLRIAANGGSFPIGAVKCRFYGNFLLKSGLPPNLEIGNLVPKSAVPPRAPPPKRTPEPPPTPQPPTPPPQPPTPPPAPPPAATPRAFSHQASTPQPARGPLVAHGAKRRS